MKAYRDLEDAQKTVISRTSAILDFARQVLGSAALHDGQLHFRTRAQADRYNLLLEQLRHAGEAEAVSMANMAATQEQAQREAKESLFRLSN
jgi:hypothetical protein